MRPSSILTPTGIGHLPVELLSLIFLHACSFHTADPPFERKRSPAPLSLTAINGCTALILSQVCREWRSVALSSPAIWSYISFSLPNIGQGIEDLKNELEDFYTEEDRQDITMLKKIKPVTFYRPLYWKNLMKMLALEDDNGWRALEKPIDFTLPTDTEISGSEEDSADSVIESYADSENHFSSITMLERISSTTPSLEPLESPISLYLHRSRYEPLSISLRFPILDELENRMRSGPYAIFTDHLLQLTYILARQCHRWSQVDLVMNSEEYLDALLPMARSLPLLQDIKVVLNSLSAVIAVKPPGIFYPHNWLGPAPKLRSAFFERFAIVRNHGPTSPGFTFLDHCTELTIRLYTPAEALPLVRAVGLALPPGTPISVRLQSISHSGDHYDDKLNKMVSHVSSLSITGYIEKSPLRQILRYLRAPRLESLEISIPDSDPVIYSSLNAPIAIPTFLPLPTFRNFFKRNGATIRSFTLKYVPVPAQLLLEILKLMPRLENLVVYERSPSLICGVGDRFTLSNDVIEVILNGVVALG
ncbi:hypothetical protein BT96DRAFT_1015635 [Gymnopus androsaceus JB14]|uniref:Uncharacterized protein n=1 Tax=Gymnopus androsaceus JB14 TaxID=1447944 RepID=A0A6A4I9E1_9AGAR|nr:hypothetical protein BT96DRAFT_1015635 [Gymnopus androsaceus JB14]